MTNIHFPVDGQGTQSLKKQNKTGSSDFRVDATTPDSKNQNKNSNKNQSNSKNNQLRDKEAPDIANQSELQHPLREDSKHDLDRREDNRRKENTNVMLNTRSEQDRRKSSGQRDEDSKTKQQQFGIDTKA